MLLSAAATTETLAWPGAQATGPGSSELPRHLGLEAWSTARLNLNENWNDSPALRSMAQRVPWPPQGKRSASLGRRGGAGSQSQTWRPQDSGPRLPVCAEDTRCRRSASGKAGSGHTRPHFLARTASKIYFFTATTVSTTANTTDHILLCHHPLHGINIY